MKWHHGHNNSIVNGIGRIGYMKGGEAAKWSDVDMADHFLTKAQRYVKEHKDKPFFLYYAMQQPHVPRTPHPRFVGKSGLGPRGDVIIEGRKVFIDAVSYVEGQSKTEVGIEIHSGRNRIVRKIFEHVGYKVVKLDRVIFAELTKKNLPRGRWRELTKQEIINLQML